MTAKLVDAFEWSAGVFSGPIPSSQTFNVNAAYRINPRIKLGVIATNVFDQKRFQLYGGSIIQRRILGSLTATF